MPFPGPVRSKPICEEPAPADGIRVFVDRALPRGLRKENCALDAWLCELAPSEELREWLRDHRESWIVFRKRYLKELRLPATASALTRLYELASAGESLTLLFSGQSERQNNAVVLRELLQGMRKPPTGTGPLRSLREAKAKSLPW